MKNIQFGRMDEEINNSLDQLKLKLALKLNSYPSNKQFLQFMIDASNDRIDNNFMVFGFDAEEEKGGVLDLIGFYKDVPEIDKDIVQVYDLAKKEIL